MKHFIVSGLFAFMAFGAFAQSGKQSLDVNRLKTCLSIAYEAQEEFHNAHGTYSSKIEDLTFNPKLFKNCDGLKLTVSRAGEGYSISALSNGKTVGETNNHKEIILN